MKKFILIIILFFNLIPVVEKGNISFIGSQSVFADEYGNENGAYDDFLDNLSNYYGLEITGTFVDSYGNFAFTLEGGGYLSPEQFIIITL